MKIAIPKIRVVRLKGSEINFVPKKFDEYILDMNYTLNLHAKDVFHGRNNEIKRIFNSLLKTQNANIMVLGENGVGKSALVQATIHKVIQGKCPKELRNHHFLYWDVERMLANLAGKDEDAIKLIGETFQFLTTYNNFVVVIEDVHLVAASMLLRYYFLYMLKLPTLKVIGITTEEDFYDYFAYESKILSSVDIINVKEPKAKKVYPMIRDYLVYLESRQGVRISRDLVEYTVSVSTAFSSECCNPGRTINYIEKSMISAKMHKRNQVTKEDINSNFNFDYELYNNMSPEDKKITAYHEAGHFIVAKLSENIKNFKTTAITIIPAEDFLGVTMFEFEPEKQTHCDADYFIDNIASDLAGRVAEIILQGEGKKIRLTSGAFSDLKNATQTARNIVTEFGMIESCGQNMTYFCNYDLSDYALLSEERKVTIDKETQNLINNAFERAMFILKSNRKLLDVIANALLENEVLDEKDLDALCAQVLGNK